MSKDTEIQATMQFKKKPHRPWKLALLKETIDDEEELNYPENLIPHSLSAELADLSKEIEDQHGEFPDLTLDLEEPSEEFIYSNKLKEDFSKKDLREIYDIEELQQIIQTKMEEKQELTSKIPAQQHSSLLIGGFLNPGNLNSKDNSNSQDPVKDLMGVLRLKEEELSKLATNLELQRAFADAEQAILAKEVALKAKQLSEERTKQVIEQAAIAKQQLQIASTQAKEREKKLTAEQELRKSLEIELAKINIRTKNAEDSLASLENALKGEKMLRRDSEIQARMSLDQIVASELAKKESEQEKAAILTKLTKMQNIIVSEQSLRKLADQKYQQAILDIENADKSRLDAVQQRNVQRKLLMDMLQDD